MQELIDSAEVRDGKAIVTYSRTEAAIAALQEKYRGATYDLTTTAGDKAARAARLELVTLRTDLEKKRKELKAPALEFGKKIDAEAARLTAEIQALEAPIDAQIKADEQRRENERRAREEAEAARKKVHTDGIAKIAGYVGMAADLSASRIATGITYLHGLDLSGFEEFTAEATATRDRSVAALQALHAKALAREAEEARLKAEREEQARIAAEQAEAARQLREQQEALERQRAAVEAEERRLAAERERIRQEEEARARAQALREQQEREAAERRQREEQEALEHQQREASAAPALQQEQTAGNVRQMPPRQSPPSPPPSLRLGEIQKRIAPLSIDAAGLAALGFPHATQQGAAKLWHAHQFHGICAAIAQHVVAVANGQREVA